MIFGENFISAKVESAKIVFGEIHFRRNSLSAKVESAKFVFGENGKYRSASAIFDINTLFQRINFIKSEEKKIFKIFLLFI